MKWMSAWAAAVLLLAGCGGSGRTDVDLRDVAHAAVSYTDGQSFSTHYTFVLSERVLLGAWSKHGPPGFRSKEETLSLSEEQAAQLQSLIDGIRLSESEEPGECWTDVPTLNLELKDTEGAEHRYPTDPEKDSCNGAEVFAKAEDVQALLDACRTLLPEPTL